MSSIYARPSDLKVQRSTLAKPGRLTMLLTMERIITLLRLTSQLDQLILKVHPKLAQFRYHYM